ncbi:MAG: FKBP-type peptidyl-prolyl cis-trans isomerase [Arsenophonus sp.]
MKKDKKNKVSIGSRITINFKCIINGKVFEASSKNNLMLIISNCNMIPGFKDSIIGHYKCEEFDINGNF